MATKKNHGERLMDCETAIIRMNSKMNAILWVFGILIALGVINIFFGQV
jgi:hypothetical protein